MGRTGRGPVRVGTLRLLAALLALGGCTAVPSGSGPLQQGPSTGQGVATEQAPPAATEDPERVEPGVAGAGGVAVEIAGLPVGGGAAVDEDGTWCQVLSWGEPTATGTTVEIHTVRVGTPGARLRDGGCDGAPPCVGALLVDGTGSCAVAVTPPAPDVRVVLVALDATVRCARREDCASVRGSDGWAAVGNPAGEPVATDEGDGDGTDGDGTEAGDP